MRSTCGATCAARSSLSTSASASRISFSISLRSLSALRAFLLRCACASAPPFLRPLPPFAAVAAAGGARRRGEALEGSDREVGDASVATSSRWLISALSPRRLRQVDVKAEEFERRVSRLEQERDQWEKKYEVCNRCSMLSRTFYLLRAVSTGSSREIQEISGRAGRPRVEHGDPLIGLYLSISLLMAVICGPLLRYDRTTILAFLTGCSS